MTSAWINETVRAFGRQMGLSAFTLNDRGAAGCAFENGLRLRLEATEGALVISVGVAADETAETMKRLLAVAHPDARPGQPVRAIRVAKAGEARFLLRLGERDLTVPALEAAFRTLWTVADNFRRAIA